jgi:hypothetical protein
MHLVGASQINLLAMTGNGDFDPVGLGCMERQVWSAPAARNSVASRARMALCKHWL